MARTHVRTYVRTSGLNTLILNALRSLNVLKCGSNVFCAAFRLSYVRTFLNLSSPCGRRMKTIVIYIAYSGHCVTLCYNVLYCVTLCYIVVSTLVALRTVYCANYCFILCYSGLRTFGYVYYIRTRTLYCPT